MGYTETMHERWPIFHKLPQTVAGCFQGKYLIAQIIAILLTILLVTTGIDWAYFEATRSGLLRALIFPAIALGGLLPILAPLLFLLFGMRRKNSELTNAAWGLGQAAILGSLLSSFYKTFTGRIPPHVIPEVTSLSDISHGFQLGFLRGGIFWGWPSSHATIAFAMATTFALLFSGKKHLKYIGFAYAAYVAFGVSVSIHWLSEAVAGVIFGTVIGLVVGACFRKRYLSETAPSS